MKTRAILLLMVAVAFVSFAIPSASFACTEPPIQPAYLLNLETWPAYAGVTLLINNVPIGPTGVAVQNWNNILFPFCGPGFGIASVDSGQFYTINMSFTAIPAPNCPQGSTCFTRGLTGFTNWDGTGRLKTATMQINNAITSSTAMIEVIAHEMGHTMGLADCSYPACAPGSSVMESGASVDVNGNPVTGINSVVGTPGPTSCDLSSVFEAAPDYVCPQPPPNPDDPCPPTDGEVQPVCSPVILDIDGKGFNLTDAAGGVLFDISGRGRPVQMGWTAKGVNNAFLALPGIDGLVYNGKQLFGNFTSQPPSANLNGFAALAVYDDPKNGGNGDGIIDFRDAIYPYLRLWIDANHDGICQPEELHTLPSLGVYSISLNYKADRRTDQYGNVFRYRAPVDPNDPAQVGRTAYDVFFVTLPPTSTRNLVPLRPSPASVQKCPVPAPTKGGLSTTGTLR